MTPLAIYGVCMGYLLGTLLSTYVLGRIVLGHHRKIDAADFTVVCVGALMWPAFWPFSVAVLGLQTLREYIAGRAQGGDHDPAD